MEKKAPLRRCIGCGESRDKKELIRIVRTPEGSYELDATGRKNGRGAYLCKKESCLETAFRKKGLDRSFRESVPAQAVSALREELQKLGGE